MTAQQTQFDLVSAEHSGDGVTDTRSQIEIQLASAGDAQAQAYFAENGADTLDHAFMLANILHTNRRVKQAAYLYKHAYTLHSKSPGQYPLAQSLLQVSLLCSLKAGEAFDPADLSALERLNIPMANYIRGIQMAWNGGAPGDALRVIGNAYDEFHTGEEADSIYLQIARNVQPSLFAGKDSQPTQTIPRNIFLYWDKNPPEEIVRNFDYHLQFQNYNVVIFDKQMAENWLYDNYGVEARSLFLSARHPAEAADFLRVHVIQLLGGWWLDADIMIKNEGLLDYLTKDNPGAVFFLTFNGVVHNDFFGSVPNSPVLADCMLSLYRNFYLHSGLFIAYKSGPGVFNRALARIAHRALKGQRMQRTVDIHSHTDFADIIAEFDTPYKHQLPSWYTA